MIDVSIGVARLVAHLIAGPDAPDWLAEYLDQWSITVRMHRLVLAGQPRREVIIKKLKEIEKAASLLVQTLNDPVTSEFLQMAPLGKIETLGWLDKTLRDILRRARVARSSEVLSSETSGAKAGRGKAMTPEAISAKTLCAIVVAEAWARFHGPSAFRSRGLAAATEAYWRECGGKSTGWGSDPGNSWRPYFKAMNEPAAAAHRAECRRHLPEWEYQTALLDGIESA